MKRIILAIVCLLFSYTSFAQKIKTGVVVFGATPAGFAAAIQSAHSGVKTVLVDAGSIDFVNLSADDKAYKIGVYADFLKIVDSLQKKSNVKNNENLVPSYVATIFKGWTDTIKNLTVFKRAVLSNISKDGKTWEAAFQDKREIKADVVIDATLTNEVAKKVGCSLAPKPEVKIYADKSYRTTISMANKGDTNPSVLPLKYFFADKVDNFLIVGDYIKSNFLNGQSAGVTGAYCSFFKITLKEVDVRKSQAELIGFKSQLIKFDDISLTDSNAISIQKVAVTGILKGKLVNNKFLFMPDSSVSTEDIRIAIREYYSRSQIWFLDHQSSKLTLEEVLSLIKFTGGRGNELDKEVEKGWQSSLKLNSKFHLKKHINRREFARLIDAYLKPFDRSIDLEGNLKR